MRSVFVGAAIVAAALGCGETKESKPAPGSGIGSGSAVEVGAGPAVIAAPKAPELPAVPQRSADETFASETRDAEWAAVTERKLAQRFTQVRGAKLARAECKQTQCRLELAGSTDDLSRAIADLEGTRGLHGLAKNVLLTKPEPQPDGTMTMNVFALFDR
jgi:hypothetical protein